MSDITNQLREALQGDGRTPYEIAKAAGIEPDLIYRFQAGQRDLLLASVAKLATVLNLELRQSKRRGRVKSA
jgi:hypothetical protein